MIGWGDPYEAFVGNINGSEPAFTGDGVYAGPIAVAARKAGAEAVSGSGWDPRSLYSEVLAGHPAVAWVLVGKVSKPTSHYRAYDGRMIPFGTGEHAIALVGVDTGALTVTVGDPETGITKTISMGRFEASYAYSTVRRWSWPGRAARHGVLTERGGRHAAWRRRSGPCLW